MILPESLSQGTRDVGIAVACRGFLYRGIPSSSSILRDIRLFFSKRLNSSAEFTKYD